MVVRSLKSYYQLTPLLCISLPICLQKMNVSDNSGPTHARKKPKVKSKWKKREARLQNVKQEQEEMSELQRRLLDVDSASVTKFSDLPLSKRSLNGLSSSGYVNPTEIQRQGIPVALGGQDVLGAAKTGSGKTLAFLIPVLECLWKLKWSSVDGLGALVISPTRELAYQTFEVLCKIGKHHDISAGLIIGGKELSFEQQRIQKTNIIVCTPGRLLQHMDETPNFDCSTLKILVLDEADRILDMGFSETVNAIIENLPEERQTLLYSATQTNSVSDLARLSLHEPQYVSAYKKSEAATPQDLKQSYVVCELQDKINFLYSFIKNHLKNKILVFLSSCKQVKFTYEAFCRLRPGVPLMALYGKQNQVKRVAIYNDFCRKTSAVLIATDIAARGLDFPAVHWVVQLDCPEDANTYVHRAGRTARYQSAGHSLLILLPTEEKGMLQELKIKKIPITEIKANPKKLNNIQRKLEGLCVQDQNIKQWAQKSVVSYVRSVYLQSNKKVFNVDNLPVDKYSMSLGLLAAPRIRFLQKAKKKHGSVTELKENDDDEPGLEEKSGATAAQSDVDQDFLVLRELNVDISSDDDDESCSDEDANDKIKTKASSAKKVLRKKIKVNSKIVFDDEGKPVPVSLNKSDGNCALSHLQPVSIEGDVSSTETGVLDLKKSSLKLVKQDQHDKREFRDRIKEKHREKRRKDKQKRKRDLAQDDEEGTVVTLKNSEDVSPIPEDIQNESNYRSTSKRSRRDSATQINEVSRTVLEDEEELVLKLLEE